MFSSTTIANSSRLWVKMVLVNIANSPNRPEMYQTQLALLKVVVIIGGMLNIMKEYITMILKRVLPLLGIMLILAGCFRQAEDNFDTIGSQNSNETTITQEVGVTVEPTDNITVIDPNASPEPSADAQEVDESPTPRVISPTEADDDEAVSATNTPRTVATLETIPTATEPTFVTPDIVEEVAQPTTTEAPESSEPTLQPTPTGFGEAATIVGDCQYEVQNGDNLFRISINNDVALDALLSANGLTQASVIQPGQILNLPDCEGGVISSIEDEEPEAEETVLILDDCDYEIQSGDTLFTIALDNEVTLADLLAENQLTDDAIIQPGQIVILPNCVTANDNLLPNTSPEATEDVSNTSTDDNIHTVVAGDTILTIARQYNVTVNSILQANTIPDPNNLTVGQQLVIP